MTIFKSKEQELPQENEGNRYIQQTRETFQKPDPELHKFLLEMETVIQQKLLHYKGVYYDRSTNKYVRVYNDSDCLMNEKGIQYANRQFRHFLHKGSSLANITHEQVAHLVLSYSSRVRRHLLHNIRNYEIKSASTVDEIKNDIVELAFLTLTRSIDDKQRQFIHDSAKVVQHSTYGESTPDKNKYKVGW